VIYFDFKKTSSHYTDILTSYLNTEFKYGFLKFFISNLIKGQSSSDAALNAHDDVVEGLSFQMNSEEYSFVNVWIPLAEDLNLGREMSGDTLTLSERDQAKQKAQNDKIALKRLKS
jgi:hypothetical protein